MERDRYFTQEEANDLIPELEARFARIPQMRVQLRAAYGVLERHGESPSTETLARADGPAELRRFANALDCHGVLAFKEWSQGRFLKGSEKFVNVFGPFIPPRS